MTRNTLLTMLITLLIYLSGCMVGPDFKEPEMDIPNQYRFAPQEAKETVNLKWWKLFNDPVLESLVITSLNENKDLLIAISRIQENRAFLGFTEADIFPQALFMSLLSSYFPIFPIITNNMG